MSSDNDEDEASYDAEVAVATSTEVQENGDDDELMTAATPDQEPDQEEEEAGAAAVVADDDDDDDEVVAVSVVVEGGGSTSEKNHPRKRPGPKPKRKRSLDDRHDVAQDAQRVLSTVVRRLPWNMTEWLTVRSLGRIVVDNEGNKGSSSYSDAHHLHPAGFSCDRYEFSPTHGRMLKLRCTILEGAKVHAKRVELGLEPLFHKEDGTEAYDGPLFRIMWGGGIDDENENYVEYPFSPTTAKAPLEEPEEGMRVRVKYEGEQWYTGTIVDVMEDTSEITIQYDDGSLEHATFPDADITLYVPGAEDECMEDGNIYLTEMNGKPVTSIVATSAIEAWGKALIAMGLIDELTLEKGLEAVSAHRANCQDEDDVGTKKAEDEEDDNDEDREDETPEEAELRDRVQKAKDALEEARAEDRKASMDLANARIGCVGPFLCNPFQTNQPHYPQETSWLSTIVRKEKAKMGSTGNKKKVVTTGDLLERNDTFFNQDVESLVEGLPGTELLPDYIFHSFRFGYVPSALCEKWQQDAQLHEAIEHREELKKRKVAQNHQAQRQSQKTQIDLEKEAKRQKREDERDARKRQKEEELEEKKRARAEERMARLNVQVEERLFKEACFQREKVVVAMAKSMTREFARRKKAAELVAMQSVVDDAIQNYSSSTLLPPLPELSPLCQVYDEEVLRCWDFMTSYGKSMVRWGYIEKLPTLDSLQQALSGLDDESSQMSKKDSIEYLQNLCIALCKPLAVSLTRLLFASLIALNPALQKDFGAAFFAEVRTNASKEEAEGPSSSDLLPVNSLTWQEVARLAFLSDALGELGNAKHEIAHILRGYRSMGHPNSKEAKRLRKTEDFPIAVLRQVIIAGGSSETAVNDVQDARVRILTPNKACAEPTDWQFYIHNIKGLNTKRIPMIKHNLKAAMELVTKDASVVADLEKARSVFDKVVKENEPTPAEVSACSKARMSLLRLLDQVTGEVYSSDLVKEAIERDFDDAAQDASETEVVVPSRLPPQELTMTEQVYKKRVHEREEYMAAALLLKQEMANQLDDEDDDDDDDDDKDDKSKAEKPQEGKTDDAKEEGKEAAKAGEVVAAAIVVENGDAAKNDIPDDLPAKIGKVTPYDDFAGDIPTAPELVRRCLAVLRTVTQTQSAEHFIYPVDPQTNPGYYETVVQPMCMQEVGKRLITASKEYAKIEDEAKATAFVDDVVAQFARNVRIIAQNCSCYSNAGATVIAAGDEVLRIFERLLLDWILVPKCVLPALEELDDDKCVEFHESDEDSMVLLCDGCEGKYNMSRLDPPLLEVPKGDWFCPRCCTGRCWQQLDPRVGKTVVKAENGEKETWTVEGSRFVFHDKAKTVLLYNLKDKKGARESMTFEKLDEMLQAQGDPVEPLQCIAALSESPGYSRGPNRGIYENVVPVPSNPSIADAAAQAITSSSVYQDTIVGGSSLMLDDPESLGSAEWSRLLTLLVMKCASSEMMNSLASKLEGDAAEKMSKLRNESSRVDIQELLPLTNIDELDDAPKPPAAAAALPLKQEDGKVKENGDMAVMVVDATTIEVVEDVKMEEAAPPPTPAVPNSNGAVPVVPDPVVSEEAQRKAARALVIDEKDRRYKIREESIVGNNIKNQLRSTISSFEEDTVSLVIENTLGSKDKGLNLSSSRCRATACDFCGLSDSAMGSPLLRVPNMEEWYELMPHMTRNRKVFLLADVGDKTPEPDEDGEEEVVENRPQKKSKGKDLIAVKITIGGELFSVADDDLFEGVSEGGMTQFLPRNDDGCQLELYARDEADLPYITGSISAHESCAISAHNARKERVVTEHKAKKEVQLEADAGMLCGRTLSIGRDRSNRSYWKFNADNAMFVCESDDSRTWRRYTDPEVIASVIHGLGKEPIVAELKQAFPDAARMLRGRRWAQALQKRQFQPKKSLSLVISSTNGKKKEANDKDAMDVDEEEDEPYQVGEDVLVESKCGKMLWDGRVIAVSQKDKKVNGYRLRYKGWSSRFDEWVTPFRVVEPIENNVAIQQEMIQELQTNKLSAPDMLKKMTARKHVNGKDRARNAARIPDFVDVAKVPPSASSSEKAFHLAKAALLMIEAALPHGAIDNSPTGAWRPEYAAEWRRVVQTSPGPYTLMACVFFLEENIDPEWMDPHVVHLLSCLPQRWKAIREATVSALCLRVVMLDQGVHYGTVDRAKYASKGRK